MTNQPLEFGYLEACEPRELVRVKIEQNGEWAIVGIRSNNYFPIIVLSGQAAPYIINVIHDGFIDGDFGRYPVLKYGQDYRVVPNHQGRCELGDGTLFKKKGALVLTKAGIYLAAGVNKQSGVRYLDLQNGNLQGEPGGERAAFEGWTLLVDSLAQSGPSYVLVSCVA